MNTENLLTYGLFIIVITIIIAAWIAGSLIGRPIQQIASLGYQGLSMSGRNSRSRCCC